MRNQGQDLGLHGSISNTAAEHVSWSEESVEDELVFSICGRIRESSVFGPNLLTCREIRSTLAGKSIVLHDLITNEGDFATPLMLVYHCNFGFPLLTEFSQIYCRSKHVEGRTPFADAHIGSWGTFDPPESDFNECCYDHDIEAGEDGYAKIILVDNRIMPRLAIELAYHTESLPRFIEWKSVQPRHFVLGLEPSNCRVDGRSAERQAGTLRFLNPGESVEMKLEIQVFAHQNDIESAIETCTGSAPKTAINSDRK
jgi:hypothetical protein